MLSTKSIQEQPVTGNTQATNGAQGLIDIETPYVAHITIKGTADLLFHAWNCEAIEEKSKARKGSDAKKVDAVETYVYRDEENRICLPAEYLRMSIAIAAKSRQDPRSPRKSAYELFKAGVVSLTPISPIINAKGDTTSEWDFIHKCRVRVQLSAVTRCRPAFHKGWQVTIGFLVLAPEYIASDFLHEVTIQAGKLVGVGDFRPTYGRFQVVKFETGLE